MRKHLLVGLLLLLSGSLLPLSAAENGKPLALIPQPKEIKVESGELLLPSEIIIAHTGELRRWALLLEDYLRPYSQSTKIKKGKKGAIFLQKNTTLTAEAYRIHINAKQVRIEAADNRGFFYALQSFRQLLWLNEPQSSTLRLPLVDIADEPRFAYRGFMLDVSRYFLPKKDLLKMIDNMSTLKLNTLHLHLTDDNGWRLEIKKYPKLTQVGAWRVKREGPFPDRRNPKTGEPTPVGGFYTQEDMKEIIRYAAEREIEIIPEIDVPAHSNAALAAYPEYACPVVKEPIHVIPGLGGKNAEIIFCAGNDRVYSFLDDVFDEVMALFPSKYIHIGGDEASKINWKACPLCQERIRKEGLHDEEALQGYFMERIAQHIRANGREVMGWDELTNSRIPENAIVFGWQGLGNAALKAAEQGHRFIMTPARVMYLIRYQGPQWFEPLTYFGNNTLKDVFDYEPVQSSWKKEYESLLMGVQGSMWTEFCSTPEDVFYLVYPRLAAVANTAWAQKGKKDWNYFLNGLDHFTNEWKKNGMTYAESMFNVQHKISPVDGALKIELTCIRPDVEIRYTTDGSEPNANSQIYNREMYVHDRVLIKAATFKEGVMVGKVLNLPIDWNLATAKPILEVKGDESLMVNGIRGCEKYTDFEWCTWNDYKENTFTIDLQSAVPVHHVKVGTITVYSMAVHKPRQIVVTLLDEQNRPVDVAERTFTDKDIFQEIRMIETIPFTMKGREARFVRVSLKGAGICPNDHLRHGAVSRYYVDEIIVK